MSLLHISFARFSIVECHVIDCPTCQRQRRALFQFQEWYGWTITCAGCGERWMDGERGERPFAPGWRRQGREYARAGLAKIGIPA